MVARPEIERILTCDESGRAAIEKAHQDAEDLLAGAEKEIAEFRSKAQSELEAFRQEEISGILRDADRRAAEIEDQARDYCQGLKGMFEGQKDELVADFMELFYREAGMKS